MHTADPIGLRPSAPEDLHRHLNLKLAELGLPTVAIPGEHRALEDSLAQFIAHSREKDRLLSSYLSPVDNRIQSFL